MWNAQTFYFWTSNVTTFPISRKCKNFNFSHYAVPAEMLYLQKYSTNFQKNFCLKDEERGSCGWKFEVHRHFSFAIATLQLFQYPENVKISIFPITQSQQKCYIFKSISPIFENFFLAQRRGTWLFWLKIVKCYRNFSFAIATLQLFPYPENVKISIFPTTPSQ